MGNGRRTLSLLLLFAVVMLATTGCGPQQAGGELFEDFGRFENDVVAVWDLDGRNMTLREDFVYVDPRGKRWVAPAGSVVNGASIPSAFWSMIGGPFEGRYRNASVVHDVGCEDMTDSWQDVHRMFYEACRAGGVEDRMAKILYYAVYNFGPRWEHVVSTEMEMHMNSEGEMVETPVECTYAVRTDVAPPTMEELQEAVNVIAEENPDAEELKQPDFYRRRRSPRADWTNRPRLPQFPGGEHPGARTPPQVVQREPRAVLPEAEGVRPEIDPGADTAELGGARAELPPHELAAEQAEPTVFRFAGPPAELRGERTGDGPSRPGRGETAGERNDPSRRVRSWQSPENQLDPQEEANVVATARAQLEREAGGPVPAELRAARSSEGYRVFVRFLGPNEQGELAPIPGRHLLMFLAPDGQVVRVANPQLIQRRETTLE